MAIKKIKMFRYGFKASDTSITEVYQVETTGVHNPSDFGAQNSGYYVVRTPENTQQDIETGEIVDSLPKINDTYPANRFFRVLPGGISADRDQNNSTIWYVTVTYTQTNQIFDEITNFAITNRVYTRVAEGAYRRTVSYDAGDIEVTRTSDAGNLSFTNSTDIELFDPADLQEEYYHTVIQFTLKQSLEFDYVEALKYIGSVNSTETTILGFEIQPYQGLMRTVTPNFRVDENGDGRWYTFYEIEIAEEGKTHEKYLQDQGFMSYFGPFETEKVREILVSDIDDTLDEDKDKPVTKPQLLDGNGRILTEFENDPAIIRFLTKKAKNWDTELELPSQKYEVQTEELEIEL